MMNSWWGSGYGGWGFPLFGWNMMLIWFIVFLVIGYFVYRDASKRGMNGFLWWVLIIIPMIGIVALVIYIVIRETGGQKIVSDTKSAMDILKERYARGEITSEQFREMSEDLRK